ncbi:OsmC family protein [Azospirillum rugosum]|uniref:Organic hydroperoxide reductase OsmC/OhrA n=1 Tax=Azospirillum rugosum TaxID=416170 RepID=A0ABS4SMX6_9PROT|nr:OsmC family protein [Azospirillum rugosum]MBP2293438.1 organic hydroperoxide reductase OsmC/OhrA [Azospirillum rugosum]MDQ0530209.1 organic hydroperoxide reductase OsmC/OhrA [Azospirillum rugosum]
MSAHDHRYSATVTWTGNQGTGTSGYKAYSRDHDIAIPGKPAIAGSSDPAFRGDATRHNPEDLLVASLSACHMLWYLHLCAVNGIAVTAYRDDASGTMTEGDGRPGRFTEVTLRPHVTIAPGSDPAKADSLHHEAHEQCFVANSVNFPVRCAPVIEMGG